MNHKTPFLIEGDRGFLLDRSVRQFYLRPHKSLAEIIGNNLKPIYQGLYRSRYSRLQGKY